MIALEALCTDCGKCCYYRNEQGELMPCKFLRNEPLQGSRCSIYAHRLGQVIATVNGKEVRCQSILSRAQPNYEGCPYNELKGQRRIEW